MTARELELLKRLEKRRDWLTTRIFQSAKDSADLSHDRAELSALEWAIETIEGKLGKEKECNHFWALRQPANNISESVFCQKCLACEYIK
jgi:hypothetical protein